MASGIRKRSTSKAIDDCSEPRFAGARIRRFTKSLTKFGLALNEQKSVCSINETFATVKKMINRRSSDLGLFAYFTDAKLGLAMLVEDFGSNMQNAQTRRLAFGHGRAGFLGSNRIKRIN